MKINIIKRNNNTSTLFKNNIVWRIEKLKQTFVSKKLLERRKSNLIKDIISLKKNN